MKENEILVLEADSAAKLADMLGVSVGAISTGANRGMKRAQEPYKGCRYVKLPREPDEPEYSAQEIREEGVAVVMQRTSPCSRCSLPGQSGKCRHYARCQAIRNWYRNSLRAFRVLCDVPEPDKGGIEQ